MATLERRHKLAKSRRDKIKFTRRLCEYGFTRFITMASPRSGVYETSETTMSKLRSNLEIS